MSIELRRDSGTSAIGREEVMSNVGSGRVRAGGSGSGTAWPSTGDESDSFDIDPVAVSVGEYGSLVSSNARLNSPMERLVENEARESRFFSVCSVMNTGNVPLRLLYAISDFALQRSEKKKRVSKSDNVPIGSPSTSRRHIAGRKTHTLRN